MWAIPKYPGIQGLSIIMAIGIWSIFSNRAAFLKVSHCCGSILVPLWPGGPKIEFFPFGKRLPEIFTILVCVGRVESKAAEREKATDCTRFEKSWLIDRGSF